MGMGILSLVRAGYRHTALRGDYTTEKYLLDCWFVTDAIIEFV